MRCARPFVAAFVVALAWPLHASAAPCSDLPNPTIGLGGSAAKPLLQRFATELAQLDEPVSLIFQSTTSCFGITAYIDDMPLTGSASFWGADGVEQICELPVPGITPDYGIMSIQPTLCEGVTAIPDGIGEFIGAVTPWSIIVPVASSQSTISAEALYFIYGFGASEGMVEPWTIDAELFARNATASSQIALAIAADIPIGKFKGNDAMTAPNMVTSVAMSENPENALGFVGAEVADQNRDTIKALAFQAYGQSCGYWPDSSPTAFDKQNVRDGHYFIWTPYRFYAPVDDAGEIIHAPTRTAVGCLTGTQPIPDDFPALDMTIDNGSIPRCAMQVWRDEEAGPLMSYQPEGACGCYYDFRATGATDCMECSTADECPAEAPACNHGYCEAS